MQHVRRDLTSHCQMCRATLRACMQHRLCVPQKTLIEGRESESMVSRRTVLSGIGAAGILSLAGCSLVADSTKHIELTNESETPVSVKLELLETTRKDGGSVPSESEIRETWRWMFHLGGGETHQEDGPLNGRPRSFYARASVDGNYASHWVDGRDRLLVRVTPDTVKVEDGDFSD